ncbi:hypothetical protein GCM10010423_57920 [Streptomyces levis]|uniref:Uncharacterized protein n=1 Tax=Streptomyces levis TaxID=285566 RepID=A0ABP6B9N0_9ACTN
MWSTFEALTRGYAKEETVRKAVMAAFVALAAVLAVAPLAGAEQSRTVACCGPNPPGWP